MSKDGTIRIGIGGWSFAPWRETFYPAGTRAADELPYASSVLATIEINGTFYRTQNEHVFAGWRASVPAGFVFAVKASRGATASSDPEKCAASIARFMGSGVDALGDALGPSCGSSGAPGGSMRASSSASWRCCPTSSAAARAGT